MRSEANSTAGRGRAGAKVPSAPGGRRDALLLPFPQWYLLTPSQCRQQCHSPWPGSNLCPVRSLWLVGKAKYVFDPVWSPERRETLLRGAWMNAPRQIAEPTKEKKKQNKKNMTGKSDTPVTTTPFQPGPSWWATMPHPSLVTQPAQLTDPFLPAQGKARTGVNSTSAQTDDPCWGNQKCGFMWL